MLQRRNLIIAGLSILAILGGYWLLRPQPILVETADVLEQDFAITVEVDGRTRVRDRYVVSAPLAGRIPRTSLRAGDPIRVGQVLTTIAPNITPLLNPRLRQELTERVGSAEAAVQEAKAMMERAKIVLARAQTEFERSRKLKERGVTTEASFERDEFATQSAERELTASSGRYHAVEHALEQARAALRRSSENGSAEGFPVFSPIDGRILRVVQESEAAVTVGAPLLEIGDPRNLEVVADILTTDAVLVRVGSGVDLERWGGPGTLEARVRRVEPSGFTKISALGVEEQRVWIVADITSPPGEWASLSDGYRVDLRIVVDEIDQATTVPIGALFRRGGSWFVFVVEEGTARLRRVEGLRRSGRMAAVTRGIRKDEVIVVYPSASLKDGSAIRTE